jgi:cytochrome c-type biogenesis protein CcsB
VIIGISQNEKYAAFTDFFVDSKGGGGYRIYEAVEKAQRTKDSARTKLDKELIKVDERTNISYMVYNGDIMRIFPVPEHPGGKWVSASKAREFMDNEDASLVEEKWSAYLASVKEAGRTGDWSKADEHLTWIHDFQKKYGASVYPSDVKAQAEILFNHLNTFDRLTAVYLLIGLALLIMVFVRVAREDISFKKPMFALHILIALAFSAHTMALGLRWYVSGHSPWSNGYESLIFIAWATVLAGFIFSRQSMFSLAATSIVSGLWLFVAHLSWMDPQITTLVPVLNSYWLTLHVSVISASYGFLALSALLSLIILVFYILRSPVRMRIDHSIIEMVRISEMSMMMGLALLSIGNILGAVWANESWGRYWSWDPKETWTFVSMMIYATVLHFRFIPFLNNHFAYALGGLLSFSAVLMTYFGVNYYLTGMHSYAAGDPVPIPAFLYYTVAFTALIIWQSAKKRDSRMPFRSNA